MYMIKVSHESHWMNADYSTDCKTGDCSWFIILEWLRFEDPTMDCAPISSLLSYNCINITSRDWLFSFEDVSSGKFEGSIYYLKLFDKVSHTFLAA